MKNILIAALFFTVLFSMSSCSSEDSRTDIDPLNGPKISSVTEKIYYDGSLDSEKNFNFNYENGILTNIVSGTTRLDFSFAEDKITDIKIYNNNVLQRTSNFTYSGDLLMSVVNDADEKTDYTYTANKLQNISGFYLDNDVWIQHMLKAYTFNSESNIQQIVKTNYFGSVTSTFKSTYEFDDFNNPFKNMNQYLRLFLNFESMDIISKNNISAQYSYSSVGSTTPILSHNYVIVYNSENYPISIKKYAVENNVNTELISEVNISYTE
ncbi:hypothetical protein [Flavobacterium sp. TBRC 19031]|uniref:hypothetical protein n=1 Tax=Flavobacterium mekongense TaxID=3379707 RepID=UPI00399A8AA6